MSHKQPRVPTEYQVDDQELFLNFYKKLLWNRMIPHIPYRLTPNTITIIGQVCGLLAVVTAYFAVMGTPILYLVSALLLLTYLTADNVDGAHARRTGRCSPVGEFLDHGLDGIASGAVLLTTVIVFRADPISMVLLCILGAAGFILVFWEQFRTGLLVIPKVSSTEGVTFLVVIELVLMAFQDPTWLIFSTAEWNVATFVIVAVGIGYAAAMAPPIVRVSQKGGRPWELLPILGLAGSFVAFPLLGGAPMIPCIAVGIFGADIVCRMIVLRHRGQAGPILSPLHALILAPLVGAIAAPNAWTVTGWATLSLIITAGLYARTMYKGISELYTRGNESAVAP